MFGQINIDDPAYRDIHPRRRPLLLIKQSRETPLSVRSRGALRLQGPKNPSVSSYGRTAPKICSVAAVPESPPLPAYFPARHCSVEAVEPAIHQTWPACNVEIMKLSMLGAPRCNKGNHAPPGVPRTRSPAAQCSIAWPRKAQPRQRKSCSHVLCILHEHSSFTIIKGHV